MPWQPLGRKLLGRLCLLKCAGKKGGVCVFMVCGKGGLCRVRVPLPAMGGDVCIDTRFEPWRVGCDVAFASSSLDWLANPEDCWAGGGCHTHLMALTLQWAYSHRHWVGWLLPGVSPQPLLAPLPPLPPLA
jgi:hypothetical protein